MADPLTPPFATKMAVVVRDDLETWQRLNVTAFLISGRHRCPPGAGRCSVPGCRWAGLPAVARRSRAGVRGHRRSPRAGTDRALRRQVELALYTRDMFATGHDADNRAVVAAVPGIDLDLVGLGLHGPKNVVDKIVKGARLHP